MAEFKLVRLKRRLTSLFKREMATPPIMPLTPRPRFVIDLDTAPWLLLTFIVCLHPSWSVDQIAELLAVFTPYIMLAYTHRPSGGGDVRG